ncbi:hypothetical protein M501DRAFT_993411 [Patellaria atrata CBS 101060]|uniref:Uncharacterized protein n=1 Tax=Patellaria atrata CBS 101060 TaxID=1346257 RepID=A0A9P4SHC2_9PEZI|nr:hypothetical protein M501DRAFT_993411 [Patellaria atrata CBS 101060]
MRYCRISYEVPTVSQTTKDSIKTFECTTDHCSPFHGRRRHRTQDQSTSIFTHHDGSRAHGSLTSIR